MKKKLCIFIYLLAFFFIQSTAFSQTCYPLISIDGDDVIADKNHERGLRLPIWLTAGQTLAVGQFVNSISVIEFTVNGTSLEFSQNKKVTTIETVGAGKTWKVESIIITASALPSLGESGLSYTSAGTYTFTTPPCDISVFIRVWGAGGGGGGGYGLTYYNGGGGGGGGYAQGVYDLTGNTSYTITVGAGGTGGGNNANGVNGGSSSFGALISATGGTGGRGGSVRTGGTGGTGSGQTNISGSNGQIGGTFQNSGNGGYGGNSPNSGGNYAIYTTSIPAGDGDDYGGGGGGGCYSSPTVNGGAGDDGTVLVGFGQPNTIRMISDEQDAIATSKNFSRTISGSTSSSASFVSLGSITPLTSGNNFTLSNIKMEASTSNASYYISIYYTVTFADGTSYTSPTYVTYATIYETFENVAMSYHSHFVGTTIKVELFGKMSAGVIGSGRLTLAGIETKAF